MVSGIDNSKFDIRRCFYISWFFFLLNYRKTFLGPLWILMGPLLFILVLGKLYSEIGAIEPALFMPHMVVGFVSWTIIGGVISNAPNIFRRARPQILQGGLTIWEIVVVDFAALFIKFLHQIILILGVFMWCKVQLSWAAILSLIGLGVVMLNAVLYSYLVGILGARYKDVNEIVASVMRLAFLATPIIWMPNDSGRGGVMGPFLDLNPFFHFVEIIRAPLLGNSISYTSFLVVAGFTIFGIIMSYLFSKHLQRSLALWV